MENENSFHSRKRGNKGGKGRKVLEKEKDICAEEEWKKDAEEILRGIRRYGDYYMRMIMRWELS